MGDEPKPGDRIIIEDAAGQCEIYSVTANGERERVRSGVSPRGRAYEIARAEVDGGTVWIGRKETPNQVERY